MLRGKRESEEYKSWLFSLLEIPKDLIFPEKSGFLLYRKAGQEII